jgi:hypothetical protein
MAMYGYQTSLRAIAWLAGTDVGKPMLYCSCRVMVDKDLEARGLSPLSRRDLQSPSAVSQNDVTGCTMVLNSEAICTITLVGTQEESMYDWRTYIIVSACSRAVYFDVAPTILYRKHEASALGLPSGLRRIQRLLKQHGRTVFQCLQCHVSALSTAGPVLPLSFRAYVAAIGDAWQRRPLSRAMFICWQRRHGVLDVFWQYVGNALLLTTREIGAVIMGLKFSVSLCRILVRANAAETR